MAKRWVGNTMQALNHLKELYGDSAPALGAFKPGKEPQGVKSGVRKEDRRQPERDCESDAGHGCLSLDNLVDG